MHILNRILIMHGIPCIVSFMLAGTSQIDFYIYIDIRAQARMLVGFRLISTFFDYFLAARSEFMRAKSMRLNADPDLRESDE
jgi:hypothetical protein